jgi:hypothetical protein
LRELVKIPSVAKAVRRNVHLGSLDRDLMLKTRKQRANMRLQEYCCLAMAMGVAAAIETRKIQGRGLFLQTRVITNENTRKGI